MSGEDRSALEDLRRLDRSVRVAVGLAILSPLSVFPVQKIARNLPLVPLGKWPAVFLSAGVAFSLAITALVMVSRAVRSLEVRRDAPLLPTAAVYIGVVILIAGLVFASVADLFKPENTFALLAPSILLLLLGIAGFLLLSARGREALGTETARRFGLEVLRYIEVLTVAAIAIAFYLRPSPHDQLKVVLLLLWQGAIVAPLVLLVAYRINRKAERYESLKCRLRSHAVALPVALWGLIHF